MTVKFSLKFTLFHFILLKHIFDEAFEKEKATDAGFPTALQSQYYYT